MAEQHSFNGSGRRPSLSGRMALLLSAQPRQPASSCAPREHGGYVLAMSLSMKTKTKRVGDGGGYRMVAAMVLACTVACPVACTVAATGAATVTLRSWRAANPRPGPLPHPDSDPNHNPRWYARWDVRRRHARWYERSMSGGMYGAPRAKLQP